MVIYTLLGEWSLYATSVSGARIYFLLGQTDV